MDRLCEGAVTRTAVELAIVLAAAAVPFAPTPLVPMVIAASLALWIRGRGWADVGLRGGAAMVGLGVAIGLLSLAAVAVIDPHALGAGQPITARGSVEILVIASLLAATSAFAAEMIRGFVIAGFAELFGEREAIWAVAAAALAWVVIFGRGDAAGAVGLASWAIGFGLLYVAGGRRLALPIAAHVTHEVGAVIASVVIG
jgi:hypothetical protein